MRDILWTIGVGFTCCLLAALVDRYFVHPPEPLPPERPVDPDGRYLTSDRDAR